jgi:hypothetical protein
MGRSKHGQPAGANRAGSPIRRRAFRRTLDQMPRYVVERTFPEGLEIPADAQGARACLGIIERNADSGVTWIRSYVTGDRSKTFCVYDAPSPEAIRRTAGWNDLPVDRITEVRVLDPYFHF